MLCIKFLGVCLILISCFRFSVSYFITVDAHAEECFFDKVETGTKMGLMFEIAEGGFLDIDVRIVGPDGKIIYQGERETSGKYTFAAHAPGVYTYCFSNQMSTMTPKVVMFNMEIGDAPKENEAGTDGAESHTKLEDMIRELSGTLTGVKHEQEYMQVRDRIHRAINESTNSRVVMWSFFEALVLVAMTLGYLLCYIAMSSAAKKSVNNQENMASESSVPTENRPICLIVLGMAGSGKTSFVNRLSSFEVKEHNPYIINLDPACKDTPYPTKIDIRNTLNYKEVMKQYRLGPNGAIVTSLNLFATKFNDVIDFIKKSNPEHKYCVIDTPGQIEVFTWSVSGTIITEGLASSFPTVIVYVIDTVRSVSPVTFMSNMLYACSILYKANLPFIVVLNKTDVVDHSFAMEWMNDFEAYQEALHAEDNDDFRYRLMDSLSMVLDEFYKDLRVCGVSALTGDGFDQFYKLVADAANEYETKYKIEWEKLRAESKIKKEKEHKAKLERLASEGPSAAGDASTSSTSITEIWSGRELSDVYLKHPANESSEDEDGEEVEMKSIDSDEDEKKEAESFKTFLANQVKKQKSRGPSVSKQNT